MAMSVRERKQAQRARKTGYALSRESGWRQQGITDATFNLYLEKLVSQNFRCAICGCPINESSALDHDHSTGTSREILCSNCNLLLGKFEASGRTFLANAPAYLERWAA